MATPIQIGPTTYRCKKIAVESIRGVIASCGIGEPITITDIRHEFITNLLLRHPHVDAKIGCGVSCFFVRDNVVSGRVTRGIWIRRLDGSEIDFSWLECIKPTTHRQRVLNAMRAAIQQDISEFKMSAFANSSPVCWITGKPLVLAQTDVHHAPTFLELAERWVLGDYDSIEVDVGSEAAQFGDFLVDEMIKNDWIAYHRRFANLHLVDRTAHKSLTKAK